MENSTEILSKSSKNLAADCGQHIGIYNQHNQTTNHNNRFHYDICHNNRDI